MRLLWTIVRLVIAVLAAVVLFVTVFFVDTPSGTSIETSGAITDAVALVVLVAAVWSLWRDRERLS